jgi:hypothetical protein
MFKLIYLYVNILNDVGWLQFARVRPPKHIPPPAAYPDGETVQDAGIGDGPVGAIPLTPDGALVTNARAGHKLDHGVPCP